MVTLGGHKVRLAKVRENRPLVQQKFHELMLVSHRRPESPTARVADLMEGFLMAAQKFAEACGQRSIAAIIPFHVSQRGDEQAWNQTTERNARRAALRVMSWAKEEGLILPNPLHGMKYPPADLHKRRFRKRTLSTRGKR